MKRRISFLLGVGVCVLLALIGILAVFRSRSGDQAVRPVPREPSAARSLTEAPAAPVGSRPSDRVENREAATEPVRGEVAPDPDAVAEGEAETERRVDAFDKLVDVWSKPSAKPLTIDDVERFVSSFKRIPSGKRDECIHRALNLVPDENVMLLAGVLMDKTVERDVIETVYRDVLNRDESAKKPILLQIFKDRSHPCWADTAWILDVTGELPKGKK